MAIVRVTLIAVAECVKVAKQLNPQGIESSIASVYKIRSGVRIAQICQNRMWRVTDDEERRIARVEHVPSVRAWI